MEAIAGLPNIQYHDPSAPSTPFADGMTHDSAAEAASANMVETPLLVLRLAQSRVESTRLVDWIRGAGARSPPTLRVLHDIFSAAAAAQT